MKIAGIVLYNPDWRRLKANIDGIIEQVDKIICVDNGSNNVEIIQKELETYSKVYLIKNTKNKGIAVALNQIVGHAKQDGATWVLTLDQDSIAMENLVEEYERLTNLTNVGMLTCIIKDRNTNEAIHMDVLYKEIDNCITSGSYIKVSAWEKSGRFDERMFIDFVDFDMCQSLKENGYSIYRVNFYGLLHEVGRSKKAQILGKKYIIFNHSPFRKYYMVRNQIYYARKHKKSLNMYREYYRVFRYFVLVMIFEQQKLQKFLKMMHGLFDGFSMKQGEMN